MQNQFVQIQEALYTIKDSFFEQRNQEQELNVATVESIVQREVQAMQAQLSSQIDQSNKRLMDQVIQMQQV